MEFSCEQIGLSKEELQERIVESIADRMLHQYVTDDEGEFRDNSPIKLRLDKLITASIDAEVERIGNEFIAPKIEALIEGATLQATTAWGEPKGEPKTFIEYLVERAEVFMVEDVDSSGRGKSQLSEYDRRNFRAAGKRLPVMIDKHLQYQVDTAMKAIIAGANQSLTESLTETVRIRLKEVADKVKVTTTVK